MAFLASGEDPNYGRHSATIRRALRSIIQRQEEKTGYLPNSMYHHGFGMLALCEAYGAVDETLLWEGESRCAPLDKHSILRSAAPRLPKRKIVGAAGVTHPMPLTRILRSPVRC